MADVLCSNCENPIPKLPEGAVVPDPPESMIDLKYDEGTRTMVIVAKVTSAYCKNCSGSVGETLRRYLSRVAPKTARPPKAKRAA